MSATTDTEHNERQYAAIRRMVADPATQKAGLRRLEEAFATNPLFRERQAKALAALRGSVPDWNDGRFDDGEDPDDW